MQIDLLVQTENTAYIVELKRKNMLGREVVEELREKVRRLPVRKGLSVRTVLVYEGELTKGLAASDEIDILVSVEDLLAGD